MAKTMHRPIDKLERRERLETKTARFEPPAKITPRNWDDYFEDDIDDQIADEILSPRTNRAY